MTVGDELVVDVLGKTESIVYPSFQKAMGQTVEALSYIGDAVHGTFSRDWRVRGTDSRNGLYQMRFGAPRVLLEDGPKVVTAFISGMNRLESPSQDPPEYFTPPVLKAVQKLLQIYRNGVAQVRYRADDQHADPTKRVSENVDVLLKGATSRWTGFRGRLARAYVPPTDKSDLKISLEDRLTGKNVVCKVPNAMLSRVKESLGAQVAVSGRCTYLATGEALQIFVTDIQPLTPLRFEDLPDLVADGEPLDHADFVRRLRDAE